MALTQVLILLVLVGVIELGIVQTLNRLQSHRSQIQSRYDRQFLIKQLLTVLSSSDSLLESANLTTQNLQLKTCLLGGAAGACASNCCNEGVASGFSLVDPLDNTTDPALKKKLTGPSANPIYYTTKGSWCQAQTASACDFKLTTTFTPHCPGGMAQCDHAEHLKIDILLEPTNFYKIIKGETFSTYYFVNRNYKPAVMSMPPATANFGATINITVTGDSGHPSETQNFIFDICQSQNTGIAEINCLPFNAGQAQVQLTGKAVGITSLQFRINDGGLVNNLSDVYTLSVEVIP